MDMALAKKQGFSSSALALAPAPTSEWPDQAVSILLKTYAQKFSIDRGYLRTQDWQEVAYAVNSVCDHVKTLKQCRDKVDSLKRRYKIEKRKAVTGGEVSWPFFHRLDDIMNSVLKQGKMPHSRHPSASSAHASADADGGDDVEIVDEVEGFQDVAERREEGVGDIGTRAQERCDAVGAENGDDGKEDKLDGSNSHDSLSASSDIPPCLENGKRLRHAEGDYDMSDREDNALHGYSYRRFQHPFGNKQHHGVRQHRQKFSHPHSRRRHEHVYHDYFLQPQLFVPSRPSTFSGGTQESTENSSHGRVKRTFSRTRKGKLECDNGIDALADAVTGLSKTRSMTPFLDMFTRIEHSKMEIMKKLRLELAKLDKKHKKSRTPKRPHRSMSTSY